MFSFTNKWFLILAFFILFSTTGVVWAQLSAPETKPVEGPRSALPNLTIKSAEKELSFYVEVADEDHERNIGLMYRDKLDRSRGMIFLYPEPRKIMMWMRNTKIALDMIFISPSGIISRIEHSAEPYSERIISSETPAKAVLEINAGLSKELKIEAGQKICFEPDFTCE